MTASDLLDCCRALDIRLWAESGRLRFDAPQGALGPDLRGALSAHKAELLELLTSGDDPAPPALRPPPPLGLAAPRRTPWGTVVSSDPAAPPIEVFGPPPPWQAPATDPSTAAEREAIREEPPDEDLASLRAIIAGWSIPWRERWGRRANEWAEQGIAFPEEERRAFVFVEVQAEQAGGAEPPPIKTPSPIEPSVLVHWQCANRFCRDGSHWWMSRWGVVNCLNCVPPAFPGLAIAQGTAAEAPLVDPGRSNCGVRRPSGS